MPDTVHDVLDGTQPAPAAGQPASVWRRLRRSRAFLVPAALVGLLVLIACFPWLFAGWFGNGDPRVCDLRRSSDGPAAGHPFGFDLQGCDVYANVIYGTRSSLVVGLLGTMVAVAIAVVIGTAAGWFGGVTDSILSRITDVFLGFPFLLGAIIVLTTMRQRTVVTVAVTLAVFAWPPLARLVRSTVRGLREMEFVMAARTLGLSQARILGRYVLPNATGPVLAVAAVTIGGVIVAESSLTFLGIGLQQPAVSWGLQLSAAQSAFQRSPHLLIFPALFLSATVLSITRLGDVLRSAFDPRGRQ